MLVDLHYTTTNDTTIHSHSLSLSLSLYYCHNNISDKKVGRWLSSGTEGSTRNGNNNPLMNRQFWDTVHRPKMYRSNFTSFQTIIFTVR